MLKITQLLLAVASSAMLVACGGGDSSTSSTPPTPVTVVVSSVTVGGVAVNASAPIAVKNYQTVVVTMSGAVSVFSNSSTLNGAPAATSIGNFSTSSTVWSGQINSAPGTVMTMTIKDSNAATLATLTFNVQSAYQGTWNGSFSGGDTGTCAGFVVSTSGAVTGSCTSAALGGGTFTLSGSVASNGTANIVGGTASTSATFSGTFSGNSASGTWINAGAGINGNWTATKI